MNTVVLLLSLLSAAPSPAQKRQQCLVDRNTFRSLYAQMVTCVPNECPLIRAETRQAALAVVQSCKGVK